jgi:ubiquinone/menaquinone biosynthesis C-methylase UbiE
MRELDHRSLNRLPDVSDWEPGTRFTDILRELRQPVTIHRKAWEYALCIEGLEKLSVVNEHSRAIAVGAGTEPVLYHFANRIARVVATDLYENPDHEGKPAMVENPAQFAPFPYQEHRLEVYRMSGDSLEFPAASFDFAFCLSSIEHFGSRETQRAAFEEMIRVIRPGGVICIITELILTGHTHSEYFSWEELNSVFLTNTKVRLVGGVPDLRISKSAADYPVDLLKTKFVNKSPHITLKLDDMVWTSFSMFFERL